MTKTTPKRKTRTPAQKPVLEITTFPSAVRFLYEQTNVERMRLMRINENIFKLERMRDLLDAMGNPHEQVRMIHVAGTVGKGSTVAMIASMLRGCEYAVGEFTSPHLIDVRERITINGNMITRSDFTTLTQNVAAAAAEAKLEPTFFEFMTAIAFQFFADQAVDIAVIETGLGGRLDSTNVITPEVSVITRIDIDHTQLLGRTITEIAREKAGILKRGVPSITGGQEPEVEAVLRGVAEEIGAPIRTIDKDIEYSSRFCVSPELGPHTRVCLITENSQFMHLPVPLQGEHQAMNCVLALAAIDVLKGAGFEFEEVPLNKGLAASTTPGRMELIWNQPRILIDGAHNSAALGSLMRSVGAHVPYDSMVCIFGCCEDKDIPNMLEKVALGGDKIIFTKAKGNPRAADPEELQRQFSELSGKMTQVAPTLAEALQIATRAVSRDDLICVTGSFFLVGETKKYLQDLSKKQAN